MSREQSRSNSRVRWAEKVAKQIVRDYPENQFRYVSNEIREALYNAAILDAIMAQDESLSFDLGEIQFRVGLLRGLLGING